MKDTLFESVRQKGDETKRIALGRPVVDLAKVCFLIVLVLALLTLTLSGKIPPGAVIVAVKSIKWW